MALFLLAAPAVAQEIDCAECHEDTVTAGDAHADVTCIECHTNVTIEHEDADLEPLTDEESCGECHTRVGRTIGRSVHKEEAGCNDCHGDYHGIHMIGEPESAVSPVNQLDNCGACHDDPPGILEGFIHSGHGDALLNKGLVDAPGCVSCHGGHDTRAVDDDRARVGFKKSPDMCGDCHLMLVDVWKEKSSHGLAWDEGNEDAPVCTTCHTSHSGQVEGEMRVASVEDCGGCHEEQLTSFRDSFHGKATELGMASSATCADCHTAHANLPADHPDSSVHPDNLMETCGACHDDINPSFATFEPHNNPADPDDNFYVYIVYTFMIALLLGVFAFFGIHDVLWLQRSLVGVMRGEFDEEAATSGQWVRRFTKANTLTHLTIVITFLLLALTGLPLKFQYAPWAQSLIDLLGGLETARILHRIAAIGTFGYFGYHLIDLFIRWVFKGERGMLWGPNSMVPQPKDFSDFWANIKYFFYVGERPQGDRWTYFEKFDYLAVFWGVAIIGFSGLFLWFPGFFTQFLPGWTLNAAYVVHSDEALLATGFIFVFHFFHTHLRPESFPMDLVIFTGKMSLERFKAERSLEYERLVASGELEEWLVDAPTPAEIRRAYVIGSTALIVGIALAVGMIWALLTH